jgi:hypothetical protein
MCAAFDVPVDYKLICGISVCFEMSHAVSVFTLGVLIQRR